MNTDQWGFPALLPSAIVRDLTPQMIADQEAKDADWSWYLEASYVDPMESDLP